MPAEKGEHKGLSLDRTSLLLTLKPLEQFISMKIYFQQYGPDRELDLKNIVFVFNFIRLFHLFIISEKNYKLGAAALAIQDSNGMPKYP